MSEIKILKDTSLPPRNEVFTDETIQKLTNGLLKLYEPPLTNAKDKISELTNKQEDLINRLTAEYNKLYICEFDCEIRIIMATIKMYKDKLLRIKRDMLELYDKVNDLKERSVRLEEQKANELRKKTIQIKKEQDLIGRRST